MADKNKQSTFADLLADSELEQKTVQIGKHSVVIQELTGRQGFELTDRADGGYYDTMLWIISKGIVSPEMTLEQIEQLKKEWVVELSTAILDLSGMDTDAADEAENESAEVSDTGGS